MPGIPPSPCRAYRIIHIDNLPGILKQGGIHCGTAMAASQLPYVEIGLAKLTRERGSRTVCCGPEGVLSDYVPFYFCYRSIMLYQIHTGQSDFQGGQETIIHLITTYEELSAQGVATVFTDRHAKVAIANFFDQPKDLEALDWDAIKSNNFVSTENDPDRPERKQAELLVHRFVPLGAIHGIGVYSRRQKEDCDRLLKGAGAFLPVKVKPEWYYS